MITNDYYMKTSQKTYKKSTKRLENAVNMEAKHIAENIKLDDRIESLIHTPALLLRTIKRTLELVIHAA